MNEENKLQRRLLDGQLAVVAVVAVGLLLTGRRRCCCLCLYLESVGTHPPHGRPPFRPPESIRIGKTLSKETESKSGSKLI